MIIRQRQPGERKSCVQRLSRLLANPVIYVQRWCEPIAQSGLNGHANNLQPIRVIADRTNIGFALQ
jgi:hypothetical protein